MDTHLNFAFKQALHFSTLVIIVFLTTVQVVLSCNCYHSTMNQSSFKRYDTATLITKVPCLVSYEGPVKCLLLSYKQMIQHYLSLL